MSVPRNSPVFVSADAARSVFRWDEAVRALQAAYSRPFEPTATPPRTVASGEGAWLRCLPALPPGGRYFGAKLMGMSGAVAAPSVDYVIVLFDRETSRIAAFVDGNLVTGYRTAATSAAALDRIAPQGPAKLAVLGSGLEASMHVRAFASVRPLAEVVIYSPTPGKREAFARKVSEELGVPARAATEPREAVEGADIALAAARSHGERPILFGDWLKPGTTIVSIGSTVPSQREIDVSVIERADFIVCDTVEEVLEETGDMIAAAEAGIDAHGKSFSLNALLTGQIESQRQAAQMPMFKSVGGGLQDIVVAEMILTRAIAGNLVTPVPIEFDAKHV